MNTFFSRHHTVPLDKLAFVDPIRALKLLSQCTRAVTRIHDEKAMLTEICRIAVEVGGYRMAWVGCTQPGEKHIAPSAFAGHEAGFLADLQVSWAPLPEGTPGPVGDALRSGLAQYCLDLATLTDGQGHTACESGEGLVAKHQAALQHGYRSLLVLPLRHSGEMMGVLVVYGQAALVAVPESEVALLQEVADNLAFALGGRRDRQARAQLEKSIFMTVPGLSGAAGLQFFEHMLGNLAGAMSCDGAALTRLLPDAPGRARVLAGVADGMLVPALDFDIATSPCQQLIALPTVLQVGPLTQLYPQAALIQDLLRGEDSATFIGHRLEGSKGQLLGMLCVVFKKPPERLDVLRSALRAFASRAAAEVERMDADQEVRRLNASLEEHVQQRTAQLKLANEELESFCYSVSHDLRTPLSAVDGFASLLEQALAKSEEPLAERQRHYLRRIRAGMVQMGELIEALLQLARLARAPMTQTTVDLSQMAREILNCYHEREPSRLLDTEIEAGLMVRGDARLIRQLMENLLGNAWKFSGGRDVTHIRLTRAAVRDDAPDQPVFMIEDKGAGFNMAYAQKLFGPFQRLHSPSEFEGSGIGLATVQRIVQRHGGHVWGEGEPEQGARFYFSLGPAGTQADKA